MNRALIYIPLLAVLLTTLNGCRTTGEAAAAIPGCAAKDITSLENSFSSFKVICKGRSYTCVRDFNFRTQCSSDD